MNDKKSSVNALLIIIVLVLIAGFVFYFNKAENKISTTETATVTTKATPTPTPTPTLTDVTTATSTATTSEVLPETAPPGPAPYLNVDNVNELTGAEVISSPKFGDVFMLGDYVPVVWDPELIDVSTARLVRLNANNSPEQDEIQIYRRDRVDDPITMANKMDYVIPKNLTVYPGMYRIKLLDYRGQNTYLSDEFRIDSPIPILRRTDKLFSIKSIIGANESYAVGEVMKLNIDAVDDDETVADTSKGFNIQARLYNIDNVGVWSGNALYSPEVKNWHLDIPIVKDTYRVQVSLYCGVLSLNSVCAQKYPTNSRADQYINFKVSR